MWETQESCPHFHDIHRNFNPKSEHRSHKENQHPPKPKKSHCCLVDIKLLQQSINDRYRYVRFPTLKGSSLCICKTAKTVDVVPTDTSVRFTSLLTKIAETTAGTK